MHIRSFEESLDEIHEYVDNYTDQLRIKQKNIRDPHCGLAFRSLGFLVVFLYIIIV